MTAGVKDVREVAERARARMGEQGRGTILFLDEVHRFNRTQQDALLPHVEEGLLVLIGATTENPFFSLTGPLLSRSTLFRLDPLSHDDLRTLLLARARRPRSRSRRPSTSPIEDDALDHLVDRSEGDARHALTSLEVAAALASEEGRDTIRLGDAEAALALRALRYGDDEHYDVLSAFIKSIRGSDVDAGLYWLARMVEAGEDPRLIARRLVILASEDVGMADPQGLVVADAAARAVEFVGMPEAQLNLAHAVVYLGDGAEVELRGHRAVGRAVRGARRTRPAPSLGICATPVTLARRNWDTARATSTPTTNREAGWISSIGPTIATTCTGGPPAAAPTSTAAPAAARAVSAARAGKDERERVGGDHRCADLPRAAGRARRDDRAARPHDARHAHGGVGVPA